MFGFFFGTVCLIALFWVIRRGRWARGWMRYGPGYWHAGPYGRFPRHWRGESRGWRSGMLRNLFERLDTTPGQEKAILAAASDLREPLDRAREEASESLRAIAEGVGGPQLDEAKVRQAFSRQREVLESLQGSVLTTLGRVHEALNETQRRQLAELIQSRGRYHRYCSGEAIAA